MTQEELKYYRDKYTVTWAENLEKMRGDPCIGDQFLIEAAKRIHKCKGTKGE